MQQPSTQGTKLHYCIVIVHFWRFAGGLGQWTRIHPIRPGARKKKLEQNPNSEEDLAQYLEHCGIQTGLPGMRGELQKSTIILKTEHECFPRIFAPKFRPLVIDQRWPEDATPMCIVVNCIDIKPFFSRFASHLGQQKWSWWSAWGFYSQRASSDPDGSLGFVFFCKIVQRTFPSSPKISKDHKCLIPTNAADLQWDARFTSP